MIDLLRSYIENRIQLIKLELISVVANIASGLVSSFLILVISMFILLMFSISLGFWLAQLLDNDALGFAIVGGIYTLIFIIYLAFSKEVISRKVKDEIVKSALEADKELKYDEEN
jgi:hypothetical protein